MIWTELKAVAGGKFDFQPDDGSDESRARFQPEAQSIIELGHDIYLEGVKSTKESETGQNYIDIITARSVAEGCRYLDDVKWAEKTKCNSILFTPALGKN